MDTPEISERVRELEAKRIISDPTDLLDRARANEEEAERHAELAWLYALLEDRARAQGHLEDADLNRRWARENREDAARGRHVMSVDFTPRSGKPSIRLISRPNPAPRFLPNVRRPLPRPRETRRGPSLRRRRSGTVRGARSPGKKSADDPHDHVTRPGFFGVVRAGRR